MLSAESKSRFVSSFVLVVVFVLFCFVLFSRMLRILACEPVAQNITKESTSYY